MLSPEEDAALRSLELSAGSQSRLLSTVARVAGIALQIVNLAFGLTLGALAVAFALAFGLGGREAAGKVAEDWRTQVQKKE